MKNKLLLIILIVLICLLFISIYFIYYEKEVEQEYLDPEWVVYHKENRNGSTRGNSVFVYENSIFVAMEGNGQASQEKMAILAKYDMNGTMLWNRSWGEEDLDDRATSVFVDKDKIYLVGRTESYGAGSYDAFILKYNLEGDLLWNRTWGGSQLDSANSVFVTNDNIYVTGTTVNYYDYDVIILKYNLDGNLIWNRTWGINKMDRGLSIYCDEDSIYITGNTGYVESREEDAFLLKYDTEGNHIWNQTWGTEGIDSGSSIYVYSGSIYVTGYAYSANPSVNHDVYLLKYDDEGNLLWNIRWGKRTYSSARAIFINNGYIYLAGYSSNIHETQDALLLKLNMEGKIVKSWYWDNKEEYVNSIFVKDGAIFMVGESTVRCFLLKGRA